MKALLLLPILSLPLLLTSCETRVVDHYPRRAGYVERDYRYDDRRPYRDDREVVVVNPRVRRDVVVVSPEVHVRYYYDSHGRYYIKHGRRIYVNVGVRY
jgi:hypothetical protein